MPEQREALYAATAPPPGRKAVGVQSQTDRWHPLPRNDRSSP